MPTKLILDKKTLLGNGSFAYVYRGYLMLRNNRKKMSARRSSEAAVDGGDENDDLNVNEPATDSTSKMAFKHSREGKEIITSSIRRQHEAIGTKPRRNSDCLAAGETHVSYQSKPVAVKRIELVHVRSGEDREEKALRTLKHPNVVKVFHVENDAHFR